MAVTVFADPFGAMQQGRNVESQIQERDTRTALELMSMQQALDQRAKEQEYIRRTQTPPPPPGPNGQPSDPTRNMSASDMMYSKIGEIDKNISVAQGLGLKEKVDALYKERDAMLSRYSIAQKREEDARKRVQDQRKETIAEVGKFAGAADAILSSDSKPEDKLQQLQALEASAQEENPDAWRMLSRGKPMNWGDPQTANMVKGLAQQSMDPAKRQELQIKALDEKRKELDDKRKEAAAKETARYHDARLAQSRESGEVGKLDDDTLRFMAAQYVDTGDRTVFQNIGRGKQGSENLKNLRSAIREYSTAKGMTPAQVSTKVAEFEGLKSSMRTLGTREANMETAAFEAHGFADLALKAADNVPRANFIPLNKLIEKVQEGTASPEQRRFVVANRSLINAYAQVVARTGAKNIHDTVEAEKMLFTADGPDAYKAGVDQLKKEIETALKAPKATREGIEARAHGKSEAKALDWNNLEIPK